MFFSKKKLLPSCPNILTPDQIPSFFIPPKLSALPERGGHIGKWLHKKTSDVGFRATSRALLRSASRHLIQVEDVEQELEVPDERHHPTVAATISPYLSESPHTRRRESLFHQMCHTHRPSEIKPLSPVDQDCILSWKASSHDLRLQRVSFGPMDSDATSSAESSPFNSPLLRRPPEGRSFGQVSGRRRLLCCSPAAESLARANSLSTEETSSMDTSPNLSTKIDHCDLTPTMIHLVPPPIYHLDFICCQEHLTKEMEVMLSKGGLLRLSVEYVKELGRLRVKLVTAENLYPSHQDPKSISCCVVMCLMPGKLQKQRSTVIRQSRNPIFNEDFYFEGVEEEDSDHLSLKVKVMNRGTGMKRDQGLGYGELRLSTLLPT